MQVKKQQLELNMKQWTDSKLGKEYVKAEYCHPAHLTYIQSTSCEVPGRIKHKLETRFLGEISVTSDDTNLMAESKEELKSLLIKVKEKSEKVGLKLSIWSHHFMANRWGNKTVRDFILGGSKITVDGDCSHEIKRRLLFGRKAMTNLLLLLLLLLSHFSRVRLYVTP